MATIFFKPMRMPPTSVASPTSYEQSSEEEIQNIRGGSFSHFQPPLLTPTRSSSLRGFSRSRSISLPMVEPVLSDDSENNVEEFEIDIDTPVSMCMRWQDMVERTSADSKGSTSSSSTTDLGSPVDDLPDEDVPEFTHTYAKANAMSLRVNPKSGLLGFRKTTKRTGGYVQEGSLGQTLADSSYVLPPKVPTTSKSTLLRSPPRPTNVEEKSKPPKPEKKSSILKVFKGDSSPSKSTTTATNDVSKSKATPLSPPQRSNSAPIQVTPASLSSEVPVAKIHIEPPHASVDSSSKVDPSDPNDIDIDEDDSIFSSLRNVDLVSSRAPESSRVRETKKQEVNKNVVAFLGGYKQSSASSLHRIKVTGDILNRAKSIRKRTAEGQLSRKLQEARLRIPAEFQGMESDLPKKSHRKRIRFPERIEELEHIYIFEVESDDEEAVDNQLST